MPDILIYTRSNPPCGYCERAKALLDEKGLAYEDTDVDSPGFDKIELKTKIAPGATTLPVIIFDGKWIGGYTELRGILENGNN